MYCRDLAPVSNLIDHMKRGLPPVAGGSLDQAAWFMEAAGQMASDEAQFKAEGIR